MIKKIIFIVIISSVLVGGVALWGTYQFAKYTYTTFSNAIKTESVESHVVNANQYISQLATHAHKCLVGLDKLLNSNLWEGQNVSQRLNHVSQTCLNFKNNSCVDQSSKEKEKRNDSVYI